MSEQTSNKQDGWAFAKELSDVLLLVRPLGGSELFVRRNGQFYADPFYCGQLLDQLKSDHLQSVKDRVRAQRRIHELEAELVSCRACRATVSCVSRDGNEA